MTIENTSQPPLEVLQAIEAVNAGLGQEHPEAIDRRMRERKPLEISCKIYFFVDNGCTTSCLAAKTRNISCRGLGVVVKRCFHQDEPVEVHIELADRSPIHMAGLTRFCRYIADGFFEVGIELLSASRTPIFCTDPDEATQKLSWLADAMQRKSDNAFANEVRRRNAKQERLTR